jgi:hypothetical protein
MAKVSLQATWSDKLQQLRWRALEETDVEGRLLSLQQRAEATRQAGEDSLFPQKRVDWLERHATSLDKLMKNMHWPALGGWAYAGWLVAMIVGYELTELGDSGLMNLLAVPLAGLLLWNVVVTVLSLLVEWKAPPRQPALPVWLRWAVSRWLAAGDDELSARVIKRFRALSEPLVMLRLSSRARAFLHVGAALLALGTITGLYAKGWSKEYRAVWESTLLSAPQAKAFLSALHGPTSCLLGLPLPLENFDSMRAGPGRDPHPGDALPWIHLYAGTLVLLVLQPRLGLAALALWRGQQRVEVAWHKLDWGVYAQRLRLSVSGGGMTIEVLAYGWRAGEEPRDRWAEVIRHQLGGLTRLQFHLIAAGDEDSFAAQWKPTQPRVMLVFNAASTPEEEVHAALARDLRAKLHEHLAATRLNVLLDTSHLEDRRTKEAVAERLHLWKSTLASWVDEITTTSAENK